MVSTEGIKKSCVNCNLVITRRQNALSCSVCYRRQHRKCHTDIDVAVYRVLERDGAFKWKCQDCRLVPVEESKTTTQQEMFLQYFALRRVVHGNDLSDKHESLSAQIKDNSGVPDNPESNPVYMRTPKRASINTILQPEEEGITPTSNLQ